MSLFGKAKFGALAAVTAIAVCAPAHAATIAGLYNTGVDNAGVALAGGDGVVDSHWTVVSSTVPGVAAGDSTVTYYNNAYVPEDANSRWVSFASDGTGAAPNGSTTTYRLSFDLTGYDLNTVLIWGSFAADNSATLLLNGVQTMYSSPGFTGFTDFQLVNFNAGVNTLELRVVDTGAPSAFRVDNLGGSGDLLPSTPAPEPATWALMLAGFGLAGSALRGRRRGKLA